MIATHPTKRIPATGKPERKESLTALSPSGIKSYLTCPAQFFYQKILRLEVPTSPNMFLGQRIHSALAAFHRSVMRGESLKAEETQEFYLEDFRQREQAVDFSNEDARRKCLDKGKDLIHAYFDSELSRDERGIVGVETHLEEEIIPDSPYLQGIADVVLSDNGELTVADVKTTASTPDPKTENWLNEVQLVAYALLLEKALGKKVRKAELWFLVKTKVPKVIRHRTPTIDETKRERFHSLFQTVVEGIEREDFAPRPSFSCRFCDVRERCEAWKGGLPS